MERPAASNRPATTLFTLELKLAPAFRWGMAPSLTLTLAGASDSHQNSVRIRIGARFRSHVSGEQERDVDPTHDRGDAPVDHQRGRCTAGFLRQAGVEVGPVRPEAEPHPTVG